MGFHHLLAVNSHGPLHSLRVSEDSSSRDIVAQYLVIFQKSSEITMPSPSLQAPMMGLSNLPTGQQGHLVTVKIAIP